ncbi:hypothetical protein SM66_00952 [Klebsiella quasipneumoniae subsp. quasipneumoniae]|nr:hypothetical protein SM66_00952 [Klebsiella quasipneumoniae subsp. quasipneumoniae]VAS68653.1 Uncharacterised protein [Klebsiella quasipneumoniae]VGD87327.1 Uncharacterised protein [Klebsiella quasipneumoniae]
MTLAQIQCSAKSEIFVFLTLGLHQGYFPRRPMHLNSMFLSLSQGIKTTVTVQSEKPHSLRNAGIIHSS